MLGPPKTCDLDRPALVAIASSVPHDHFYRHLERTLDLAFVRDLAADCYASGGRPSIDPEVFFKLHLVLFFERLRSERKLIEIASLNLAHHWYLGYNLDESLPDHSSPSKIRTRLGLPVFRWFFAVIIERCVQAGLVWDKELIFDATNLPKGRPAPTRRWTRSSRSSVSSWTTISPRSRICKGGRKRRAGSCWRNAVSTPSDRRPRTTSARAIGASVPPILTRP